MLAAAFPHERRRRSFPFPSVCYNSACYYMQSPVPSTDMLPTPILTASPPTYPPFHTDSCLLPSLPSLSCFCLQLPCSPSKFDQHVHSLGAYSTTLSLGSCWRKASHFQTLLQVCVVSSPAFVRHCFYLLPTLNISPHLLLHKENWGSLEGNCLMSTPLYKSRLLQPLPLSPL